MVRKLAVVVTSIGFGGIIIWLPFGQLDVKQTHVTRLHDTQ